MFFAIVFLTGLLFCPGKPRDSDMAFVTALWIRAQRKARVRAYSTHSKALDSAKSHHPQSRQDAG